MDKKMNGNENENRDGPVVIGVGLPRTGTMSSALALTRLLDCDMSRIHHGMQLNKLGQEQLDFWIKALEGRRVTDQEWRAYFRHYKACLDLPTILFYKVSRNFKVEFEDHKI